MRASAGLSTGSIACEMSQFDAQGPEIALFRAACAVLNFGHPVLYAPVAFKFSFDFVKTENSRDAYIGFGCLTFEYNAGLSEVVFSGAIF